MLSSAEALFVVDRSVDLAACFFRLIAIPALWMAYLRITSKIRTYSSLPPSRKAERREGVLAKRSLIYPFVQTDNKVKTDKDRQSELYHADTQPAWAP